jgi:hypothetical protein
LPRRCGTGLFASSARLTEEAKWNKRRFTKRKRHRSTSSRSARRPTA